MATEAKGFIFFPRCTCKRNDLVNLGCLQDVYIAIYLRVEKNLVMIVCSVSLAPLFIIPDYYNRIKRYMLNTI